MIGLDSFFTRRYNRETYNCAHFACEVWTHITGRDITKELDGFLQPPKERRTDPALRRVFRKLDKPESPCLVLMQRHRSVPHVGVFVRGKVIHLHEMGVEFLPVDVASRGFEKLGFYKC